MHQRGIGRRVALDTDLVDNDDIAQPSADRHATHEADTNHHATTDRRNAHHERKSTARPPAGVGPPPKHHLALMIWLAVFPTLIVLQLLLRGLLAGAPMVLRTLALATVAVPIVVYGLMPPLQRLRVYLITPPRSIMTSSATATSRARPAQRPFVVTRSAAARMSAGARYRVVAPSRASVTARRSAAVRP